MCTFVKLYKNQHLNMSDKELKEYIKEFKKLKKEILSSKENSIDFLVDVGTHTKTGRLSKPYKDNIIQR